MPTTVRPLPVTTRHLIVQAYDPFFRGSEKALIQSFRGAKVISSGVSGRVRLGRGRIHGTIHLYCGLNRDSVRLHRLGQIREAQEIAQAASEIESEPDFRGLVDALAQREDPSIAQLHWPAVEALLNSVDISTLLQSTAVMVEAVRLGHEALLTNVQTIAGIVTNVQAQMATIQAVRGTYQIPAAMLAGLELDRQGAAVELAWQLADPAASLVSAGPAVPGAPNAGPIVPFGDRPIVLPRRSSRQHKLSLASSAARRPPLPIRLPD